MEAGLQLLTPKGRRVVETASGPFSAQTRAALAACEDAMGAVRGLDLESHELVVEARADLSTWDALAPAVSTMLQRVKAAVARLRALFPADQTPEAQLLTSDIDEAFTQHGGALPGAERDEHLDRVLAFEPVDAAARVGGAVSALTAMLDADVLRLGQQLRRPEITSDRWQLLGALHEMKSNSAQCLDALIAAVLQELSPAAPDQLIEGYANATRRALRLRSDLRDLELKLQRLESELDEGRLPEAELAPRIQRLLDGFAQRPSFEALRPADRKIVLELRAWALHDGSGARRRLEDLRRFLELMEGVNRRDVLTVSDRRQAGLACMLLESDEDADAAWPHVKRLYGRDPEIDGLIRAWRHGRPPTRDALLAELTRVRAELEPAAAGSVIF